jgi:5-methylcytosine-specific restriction protein A
MALSDLTADAVLKAIDEFDQLGREAFLEHYRFGAAQQYFLEHAGGQYDSKAIAGVAHKFARPDKGPLAVDDFSGGERRVAARLRKLGFVVTGGQNADWTRDELILALELYMRNPRSPPSKKSNEVAELCRFRSIADSHSGASRTVIR